MQIKLRLFAVLKEHARKSEIVWESSFPLTCGELIRRLGKDYPSMALFLEKCSLAQNGRFVQEEGCLIQDGDEIAILPPFSGG